jgi:hypothetical protein
MRKSDIARNAGAVGLGLLIAGAIVFGQRGGWEAWLSSQAEDADGLSMAAPGARLGRTAGPHLVPPSDESIAGPEAVCMPAYMDEGSPAQLMQAQ